MQPEATPPRRTVVLAGVVTLAGAGTLAACGSGGSSGSSTVTASAPAGGASSPSASASGASPSASGGASAEAIVKLADVPVGGAVAAAGGTVVVAQPTAGQVVGYSAICPHAGCKVTPAGAQLRCPCHGSTFELATGKVLRGPAKEDLSPFPVKVSGQDVVAG
jgi:nitrite reductase/ring-hydroxylating ferredoxin subunit